MGGDSAILTEGELVSSHERFDMKVIFDKNIYTKENLKKMELNERQIKVVVYVKEKRKITNR